MGGLFSSCKSKTENNKNNEETINPAIALVDTDGKSQLQYIMNYDSIPYFIPQIKYAKVTDVRQNYTIVVAAPFPNKDSPIHRFPIKLKHIEKEFPRFKNCGGGCDHFESNLDTKAISVLTYLICSQIVELRDIENHDGTLYADVYYTKIKSVSDWLIDNNLAVDIDHKYAYVKQVYKVTRDEQFNGGDTSLFRKP